MSEEINRQSVREAVAVFDTEDSQTGVASFKEHGPGKATFQGR